MNSLNFHYFTFSTYILIIGIAFIIGFTVFYNISLKHYSKIDIIYGYLLNICGFALGSKILSLLSNNLPLTFFNFINSGYSFIGGLIGSVIAIFLYCKRYELKFSNLLATFTVIYPLIYSLSKIGCYLNNCCYGIISLANVTYKFPLQLIDSVLMFGLFLILIKNFKHQKDFVIFQFFELFGIMRFIDDFFRYSRNIVIFNLTLDQIICLIFIVMSIFLKNNIDKLFSNVKTL